MNESGSDMALRASVQEPVEVILKARRDRLQKEIEDIDKAIKILEEQPKLLDTLNLLRRVGV